MKLLDAAQVRAALAITDLTEPRYGHAISQLVADIENHLRTAWTLPIRQHRANPVVPVVDNYDRLGYSPAATARSATYTRYLTPEIMLRAHTTAMIPPLLDDLADDPTPEEILSCPGITYRRDVIDRYHVGEPHQLDIWRRRIGDPALNSNDLTDMVSEVMSAVLPGHTWKLTPSPHPYTVDGKQIDVVDSDGLVEVGECGLAHPSVIGADRSGLAMGLGLDRILMLRKGIPDIRLLRSTDPRVREQMRDLTPYRPVSAQPAIDRDLSLAVGPTVDEELLGDRLRSRLGTAADLVEELRVLSRTPAVDLPVQARQRLEIRPDEDNVLVRITLRDLHRTLTDAEANRLRDLAYAALHHC